MIVSGPSADPHQRLGQHLAMELQIVFHAPFRRMPALRHAVTLCLSASPHR